MLEVWRKLEPMTFHFEAKEKQAQILQSCQEGGLDRLAERLFNT